MPLFKETRSTTNARLMWVERLVWIFIYGGLLTAVLGFFIQHSQGQDAHEFFWAGGGAVVVGVVLIYVRSRIREDTTP